MNLQQSLFQQQAKQIDQWGQFILNRVDQLRSKNDVPITTSSTIKDGTTVFGKRHIGFILPTELNNSAVSSSPSSDNIFGNGTWSNRYFQFAAWHGPFKHQMTFNSNYNIFEGYSEDDVGLFILSGIFSKDANRIDIIQSYKYGTGNPPLNAGHQCRSQMVWNKEKHIFEGILYVPNGWMMVPGGQFEMSLIQSA